MFARRLLWRAPIFLVALNLSACGDTEGWCETRCGLSYEALPPDGSMWNCEALLVAESVTLSAFDRLIRGEARQVFWRGCQKIQGAHVRVMETATWDDGWNGTVAGLTSCPSRRILVGVVPWRDGAFAHELAHLISGCRALGEPTPPEDVSHGGWTSAGVWAAIDAARAQ